MEIRSIAIFHITNREDLHSIEEIIRNEDEETFSLLGPYFCGHRGNAYLLNILDVGLQSESIKYLEERYNLQGGFELSGTADELDAYNCLLSSQECYACRLGDRMFILPQLKMTCVFVDSMRSIVQYTARRHLLLGCWLGWAVGTRLLCWPYYYLRQIFQQQERLNGCPVTISLAVTLVQFVPMLIGMMAGGMVLESSMSLGGRILSILAVYVLGAVIVPLKWRTPLQWSHHRVSFESAPGADMALGFLLMAGLFLLAGASN